MVLHLADGDCLLLLIQLCAELQASVSSARAQAGNQQHHVRKRYDANGR